MFNLIPLIIVFPLIGLIINLFWGKQFGEKGVGAIASGAAGLSFLIAVLQLVGLMGNDFKSVTVPLADWIVIDKLNIPWAFQIDTLSVTMMLVVTGVGTLIHIYAIGYMHGDVRHNGDPDRFPRFFVYLNLFLAAMLILVTGNNYLMMFVGWEGVGLCSYLLIGFWFEKGENNVGNARAGRKAFVANRVGDWAMLLAMFLIFWKFGTLTFNEVFHHAEGMSGVNSPEMVAITLLLLVGATGKSAQIPLYVWLPDAMAGPTPVSALIHAATMVTAGIYMITRSHALFALAPISQNAVALVGAATALFAATIAVGQFDIKKVLAYSTISQLGFMVAAIGMGAYVAGMFHLITHAFFKALLFLSAGSVIHAMEHGEHAGSHGSHGMTEHGDEHASSHQPPAASHQPPDPQDMRNMGGLWTKLPITKWVYLIGALALAGIFPLAGFWSKDEILLDAFTKGINEGQSVELIVYILLTIAAFFTAFYMGRQILMIFFGQPRTEAAKHAAESPPVMTYPLIALAVLSVLGGALNLPTIFGMNLPGAHVLTEWLGHTLGEVEAGKLDLAVAGISTVLALGALAVSYAIYRNKPAIAEERDPLQALGPLFIALNRKWWVDELYDFLILRPYNWLAQFTANVIDWRFWHDWFHEQVVAGLFNIFARGLAQGVDLGGVDLIISGLPAALSRGIASSFRRLQTGYVRNYALAVFVGVVGVLGYFLLVGLR